MWGGGGGGGVVQWALRSYRKAANSPSSLATGISPLKKLLHAFHLHVIIEALWHTISQGAVMVKWPLPDWLLVGIYCTISIMAHFPIMCGAMQLQCCQITRFILNRIFEQVTSSGNDFE